ncbi:TfoX/Sxy family protein [Ramlibacter sp. AN1133]|uniref:TfoX/Sxy family protein n=1 Tax=Ramlibacter sp. AN1133 TaxID=3133429 RepID=UPI0030BD8452
MAAQAGFATYCAELLAPLGEVRCRRMFGGWGLYVDDVFVAIIAGETLYLKVDEETRASFQAAGCSPFEYTARGRRQALGFLTVPPEAMDSPRLMQPWARLALDAALRARARTAPSTRQRTPPGRRSTQE